MQWQPPVWDSDYYHKHLKSNRRNWERSVTVATTGMPDEAAQYDPTIPRADIERLEMRCVQGGGILIRDRCHVRTYYMQADRTYKALADITTLVDTAQSVSHVGPISEK